MKLLNRRTSSTNSVIRQFGNSVISPNSVIRQFGNSVISPNSVIRQFGNSVIREARKGFTLIEVNLAMLIMAGGILSIVGLYAFGFRENRQGREDVASSAFADAVVSPLVMAISATNLKWSAFREEFHFPGDSGWGEYFNAQGIVSSDPESKAENAFSQLMGRMRSAAKGQLDVDTEFPSAARNSAKMSCGLVIQHPRNSATVSIGFRATRSDKPGTLLAMPLFFTEVRFQGLANE